MRRKEPVQCAIRRVDQSAANGFVSGRIDGPKLGTCWRVYRIEFIGSKWTSGSAVERYYELTSGVQTVMLGAEDRDVILHRAVSASQFTYTEHPLNWIWYPPPQFYISSETLGLSYYSIGQALAGYLVCRIYYVLRNCTVVEAQYMW
jgi:hypothetical protein